MSHATITTAPVSHAPVGAFRTSIADGSATVLVADRRADRNGMDVRVRAPKDVTVRHAVNAIAHRSEGWTADMVADFHGVELSREPAKGSLRAEYLAILAREGR